VAERGFEVVLDSGGSGIDAEGSAMKTLAIGKEFPVIRSLVGQGQAKAGAINHANPETL
jgi:hypothetical protein